MTGGSRPGPRVRVRRLGFALSTLLGLRARGFFIPYRYAADAAPGPYPALEPLFRAAEMLPVLDAIDGHRPALLGIRDDPGPARFDQSWFPRLDAAAAYAIVRRERPSRIVEVGSGHSTRFLARAVLDGGLATEVVAVDPAPRAALAGLAVRHDARMLGAEHRALVAGLGPGDVLFVDSSHVAMPGTDLDRIVGDVLPRLRPGVLVHLHDILLPDPYPERWAWRGYNEQIVAAALLQGGYELLFSSRWAATRLAARLREGVVAELPLAADAVETSLWLRKRPWAAP